MAMFREHVATGAVVSTAACVAVYSYALVTDPILLFFLFGITIVGSFLPDVDSDSGLPFYFVFGTATLAATGVVVLYTLNTPFADDWRYLLGIPAAALFFLWFVVGGILKKCTKHRGIFHSLPALCIASAATYLLARHYGLNDSVSLIFAGAMGLGFLSHLVLDELYSEITLDGIPFNTKASAGTAMKWFSKRRGVNVATYCLLATLMWFALQPQNAFAFYNDSDIIELEGDAPPAQSENEPFSGDGGDSGSNDGHDDAETQDGAPIQGSSNSGDGASSGGTDVGASSNGSNGSDDDEDLLDTLISEGVITGASALSGRSLFEDSLIGARGGGVVRVDGDSVRRFFRGKYDLQELLLGWRAGADARLSARGLGYVAASTALRDRNVQTVSFSADSFEIRYRSRGYLFSIIPITFPVRVAVFPELASERVRVTLPWYRFFVREFFTARGLAEDVDAIVQVEIEKNASPDADLKAVLFTAVVDYLRTKVGTVSDTVGS